MAKKPARRRQQAKASIRQAAATAANQPAPTSQPMPARRAASQPAPAQSTADLAAEYHYVLSDLRRIGILAVSMFALLIAIALVAQYVIK